jgi:hypothetical protein
MNLRPGDILLVKRRGLVGGLIRRFSGPNLFVPGVVNHAAMMVDSATAVETGWRVRLVPIEYYDDPRVEVAIFRRDDLSGRERLILGTLGRGYAGRQYDVLKIIAHLLDALLFNAYLFRRLAGMDKYPICSWIVAHSYWKLGVSFGADPPAVDPDDIWRAVTRDTHYEFIHGLERLNLKEEA